jgi:lysozyme
MSMKMSDKGVALIKAHEGMRLNAYLCPGKKWTIGYGHTSAAGEPVVREGMRITRQEAETILRRDLAMFEARVNRLVKVPLTQSQFDALVSFDFNTGKLHSSTLLKRLNAGKYAEVPRHLMRWTRGGGKELAGLVRRRRDEAELWRALDPGATGGVADIAEIDEPKAPKPIRQSKTANAAFLAGAVGAIAPVNEIIKTTRETADGVSGLMAAGPWIAVAVVVIAAAAFIIWDRQRRLVEDGV